MADVLKSFSTNRVPSPMQPVASQHVPTAEASTAAPDLTDQEPPRPLTAELRKRLAAEQEKTNQLSLQIPPNLAPLRVPNGAPPPGYAETVRHEAHSGNATLSAAYRTAHTPAFHNFQPPVVRTSWEDYYKQYEQEMRTQFLKSITKGPRLEFPNFDGNNPGGWIRQSEKFFQRAGTPAEYKVNMAQMHIIGKVDIWLRRSGLLKKNPAGNNSALSYFTGFLHQALMISLTNSILCNRIPLRLLNIYTEQFEELMADVQQENPYISESWFVKCFVNGLRS